jgi:hypothetical protein
MLISADTVCCISLLVDHLITLELVLIARVKEAQLFLFCRHFTFLYGFLEEFHLLYLLVLEEGVGFLEQAHAQVTRKVIESRVTRLSLVKSSIEGTFGLASCC